MFGLGYFELKDERESSSITFFEPPFMMIGGLKEHVFAI